MNKSDTANYGQMTGRRSLVTLIARRLLLLLTVLAYDRRQFHSILQARLKFALRRPLCLSHSHLGILSLLTERLS